MFLCEKTTKYEEKTRTKSAKTAISGIFSRKKFFFENRAPSHFGHCHFASLCKKSEKTNEPIPRKAGNRRTDGRTKVNLKDLRGRSKNLEAALIALKRPILNDQLDSNKLIYSKME